MILLLAACSSSPTVVRTEPTFLTVTLDTTSVGSDEAPLPFSAETATFAMSVQALDRHGEPVDVNGDLKVSVRPGRLDSSGWVDLVGGQWSGDVSFHSAFGPARVWFTDNGDTTTGSERDATWTTGVSEPITYAHPTISEMQRHDDPETNQLDKEFAPLRVEDRQVIVAVVGTDGFWATDIMDEPGSYNSLFVYTFNKPDDEVVEGARLTLLTGNSQEYLASTQLSFPNVAVAEGESYAVPDPIEITSAASCDDNLMEGLEASLVTATNPTIPSSFTPDSEDYLDFIEYGQWPLTIDGGCTLYVSSDVVETSDFYAPDHAGETLDQVTGLVTQIYDKWVLTARNAGDVGGFEDERRRRPSRPAARKPDGSRDSLGLPAPRHPSPASSGTR